MRSFLSPSSIWTPSESNMDKPLLVFSMPSSFFVRQEEDDSISFGLFAPHLRPWIQLILMMMIQSIIQCVAAIIIYQWIVLPRKQRRHKIRSSSFAPFVFGWGIIIPFALVHPFWMMDYFLPEENRPLQLLMTTSMTVIGFRCIEAMYGTSPEVVETSLTTYLWYYSTIVPKSWRQKQQTSHGNAQQQLYFLFDLLRRLVVEIGPMFLFLSCLLSFLCLYDSTGDYRPFLSTVDLVGWKVSAQLLSLQHLMNAYLHAWLVYGTLFVSFELAALLGKLQLEMSGSGDDKLMALVEPVFLSPFTKSRTPTEFWTRRWNRLTQAVLKAGVFQPARQFMPTKLAVFVTFLVSGLYHDYVWAATFYTVAATRVKCSAIYSIRPVLNESCCAACHAPQPGRVTCFFVYVGIVILLERPVSNWKVCQRLAKVLPSVCIAQLLMIIHLPFVHWYMGDWIVGGFFEHFSPALLRIKQIST